MQVPVNPFPCPVFNDVRFCKGFHTSAVTGENLLRYFSIPRNKGNSFLVFDVAYGSYLYFSEIQAYTLPRDYFTNEWNAGASEDTYLS